MRTYCDNKDCPYKDCDIHISRLKGKREIYTFANLGGVCARYIRYVATLFIQEVQNENNNRNS